MTRRGFTLVEMLVGAAVFAIIAVSIYGAFANISRAARLARLKMTAAALANEQFEIMRGLTYDDVGIVGSVPPGKISHEQTLTRDGSTFQVTSVIRNVDDPFDGQIGGTPNDLSPADYKLAALEISCTSCADFPPLSFTTFVAPPSLETSSGNGALFVRVFDAAGQPVPGADVRVVNNQTTPETIIEDSTNNNGVLEIVDTPPGAGAYNIIVSKPGYSDDQTYPLGGAGNPNPLKPDVTVAVQQLTQASFAIDRTASLAVSSVNNVCAPVADLGFSLIGAKLIGADPDVLKYNVEQVTDSAGEKDITGLEWDTYDFNVADSSYSFAGSVPLGPLNILPGAIADLKLVVESPTSKGLSVAVIDAVTKAPLDDAQVTLASVSQLTSRAASRQNNWSIYSDTDGNIDLSDASELKLLNTEGLYAPSGYLTSTTFDLGATATFYQLSWLANQPAGTAVKFQVATNNDDSTWNFVGPDGTAASFYETSGTDFAAVSSGDRYLRCRVFLNTTDPAQSPTLFEVSFDFNAACVPPGQTFFRDLVLDTYDITVEHSGYQTYSGAVDTSLAWQRKVIELNQ